MSEGAESEPAIVTNQTINLTQMHAIVVKQRYVAEIAKISARDPVTGKSGLKILDESLI